MRLVFHPLDELAQWQEEEAKVDYFRTDIIIDGKVATQDEVLMHLYKQLQERRAKGDGPRPDLEQPQEEEPCSLPPIFPPEYPDYHRVSWSPFHGNGRYSLSGLWHLAWGKGHDQHDYRLALSHEGTMIVWASMSRWIMQGWVADNGHFALCYQTEGDWIHMVLFNNQGEELGHWQEEWRSLRITKYHNDGRGFAFVRFDEEEQLVRFDG